MDPRETKNTKPLKKVAPFYIHPDYPDCLVMIRIGLSEELWNNLVEFLEKNYDVFACSQGDVLGIDPQVAVLKLFFNPNHPLVCQKRRKFISKCLKVIEEEVAKLIKANVIRETHYLDWLANIVVAPKKGEVENVC